MRNGFTDIPVASADSSTDAIWLEKSSPSRMAPERMSLSMFLLRIRPVRTCRDRGLENAIQFRLWSLLRAVADAIDTRESEKRIADSFMFHARDTENSTH